LKYSCSVGGTHVQSMGGAKGLSGPKAVLFFAPAQIAKRRTDWGGAELNKRLVHSWAAFAQAATSSTPAWLEVQDVSLTQVQGAYAQLLQGKSDPRSAQVWRMHA
jgi:Protein of unknown function (DUF2855)